MSGCRCPVSGGCTGNQASYHTKQSVSSAANSSVTCDHSSSMTHLFSCEPQRQDTDGLSGPFETACALSIPSSELRRDTYVRQQQILRHGHQFKSQEKTSNPKQLLYCSLELIQQKICRGQRIITTKKAREWPLVGKTCNVKNKRMYVNQ